MKIMPIVFLCGLYCMSSSLNAMEPPFGQEPGKSQEHQAEQSSVDVVLPPFPVFIIPELDQEASERQKLNELLIEAARNGDVRLIPQLIALGADVNYRDANMNSVLMLAAIRGNPDIVEFLIRRGANKMHRNAQGNRAYNVINPSLPTYDRLEALLRTGEPEPELTQGELDHILAMCKEMQEERRERMPSSLEELEEDEPSAVGITRDIPEYGRQPWFSAKL